MGYILTYFYATLGYFEDWANTEWRMWVVCCLLTYTRSAQRRYENGYKYCPITALSLEKSRNKGGAANVSPRGEFHISLYRLRRPVFNNSHISFAIKKISSHIFASEVCFILFTYWLSDPSCVSI